MLHVRQLQAASRLGPVLRRPQRQHLLQGLLRQELRGQGIRVRLRRRLLAVQRCVSAGFEPATSEFATQAL
jgi:hypothetical protein